MATAARLEVVRVANSVLYFPSIRVPEPHWFIRVLLYWDSVGTIVPVEFLDDPKFLRPYTAGLIDHGLVQPVTPDSEIWALNARKYLEAFLSLIDSFGLPKPEVSLDERETVRIHVDKTGSGIAAELAERKLARRVAGPEWGAWFDVEKRTGNFLMAYLAAILGRRHGREMDPITDSEECLAVFSDLPRANGGTTALKESIRTLILTDILPAPTASITPDELAKFKNDHRDSLVSFRIAVEQAIISAAAIDDVQLRAEKVNLTRQELNGQLEDITRRMQERRWRQIKLGTLGAVAASAVALADAFITQGSLTLISSGSLGLVSAVSAAFAETRPPKDFLGRPMAYAALARRRLIQ